MKRATLISIIVSALVTIGLVVYFARPRTEESENVQLHEPPAPAQPTPGPGTVPAGTAPSTSMPSGLANCVAAMNPQTSISSLAARHQLANSLLQKKQLDGALNEFRNIATVDPGYPAINLDISDVLLKSRHASEARNAIKLQVDISECISHLPQAAKLEYCNSEWGSWPKSGCISQLATIAQKAHDEAVIIDTELARGNLPQSAPETSAAAAKGSAPVAPRPTVGLTTRTASVFQKSVPASALVEAAATPPPLPPVSVKSTEASQHVGQLATVCGDVVGKHTAEASNGKPTFVNFDRPFPNPSFTVLIWGSDGPAVGDFPETGSVCVTGTIATFRGSPEIVVHDAKSWFRSDEP